MATILPQQSEWQEFLKQCLDGNAKLQPLIADGSDRKFYRVYPPGRQQSAVLVVGVEPPFSTVTFYLRQGNIPVPQIYTEDAARKVLLEEDFGDILLGMAAKQQIPNAYREAVELIQRFQRLTPLTPLSGPLAFQRKLDAAALEAELVFFQHHFLQTHLGLSFAKENERRVRLAFHELCQMFAQMPLKLAHRDYHSRNLMLKPNGSLGIVDHQDTRLAPPHYDLASLLGDAYFQLPEPLMQELLALFQRQTKQAYPLHWYWFTAAQRGLKALGSFGFLLHSKKKPHFADAIPAGVQQVRKCFQAEPKLDFLRRVLAKYIEELA